MEVRDPEITKWIEQVLEYSKTAIARLNPKMDSDFYAFESYYFWNPVEETPPSVQSNRYGHGRKFDGFHRYATEEEISQFIKNQISAVATLNNELFLISSDPVEAMHNLEFSKRLIDKKSRESTYPDILFNHIWKNREHFSYNPKLQFITNLPEIIQSVYDDNPNIRKIEDFYWAVSAKMRDISGVDINPYKVQRFLTGYCNKEYRPIQRALAQRRVAHKEADEKIVKVEPPDPSNEKVPNDIGAGVGDVFDEATISPRKAARNIGGGRAHGRNKYRPGGGSGR